MSLKRQYRRRCFRTVVLEKTLETPLYCKEIQPVNPKRNQSWIFIGRTDAEAESPILWPPDAKSQLTGKDPDAGKDWRQEEKGVTEDEMVGWHHRHNRHDFEKALGDGKGHGSLVCFSPWGHKEWDRTERLNWTELLTPTQVSEFDLMPSPCQPPRGTISELYIPSAHFQIRWWLEGDGDHRGLAHCVVATWRHWALLPASCHQRLPMVSVT